MNYLDNICRLGWIYQGYKRGQRFTDDDKFVQDCRNNPHYNYIFTYYFI